ncbi:MAG: type II secretion system protein [Candidatus Gastranaerophilaceae bacterium]
MTKRFGFTLAEVLITLGIIGVVAAMTIPTLIANTNGAKFRSQFKKTISTLNQAGLMAQAQYDFDYAGTTEKCGDTAATENPESKMTFCSILNGTLTGQTYIGAIGTGSTAKLKRNNNGTEEAYTIKNPITIPADISAYIAYTLADGSIVAFNPNAQGCELPLGTRLDATALGAGLASCVGFIDVNGVTLPNTEVSCVGTTATDREATQNVETPCVVKNDATHMTDVFPIVFHDSTVEPASDAAKYVLTSSK